LTTNELKTYAIAGSIAEETLTAIRTVFAFNGSQKELARYTSKLEKAKKFGIKKGFISGLLIGFLWFVIFGMYALGFYYGWKVSTEEENFSIGSILAVFFLVLVGVFSLGNGGPYISTAASSRAAAYEIFQIIDRQPEINSSSDSGEKIEAMQGDIEYSQVEFSYPSRPDIPILRGADIRIKAGSTVALVGHSGCGKSTCIQLLQRFYDPVGGAVRIDGVDVKTLNVKWLRGQLGVVSQEPVLFGTSISENIKFGKTDATDAEVVKAAQNAKNHRVFMT
jgi:ATP-binding cassette subfamily B (MDR/TAP) protein 1